jgi:hypothetical protein
LLSHGADFNTKNKMGDTALVQAVEKGDRAMVIILMNGGANPDLGDCPPLVKAALGGYTDIVQILLRKKANVNQADSLGNTALMAAAFKGRGDISKLLLSTGANVDLKNHFGDTALVQATQRGNTEIAELLKQAPKAKNS